MAGVYLVEDAKGGCSNVTGQPICVCAAVDTVRPELCA